jgi:tight adherence protein C
MTLVIITALGVGVGLLGVIVGVRGERRSLQGVLANLSGHASSSRRQPFVPNRSAARLDHRAATLVANSVGQTGLFDRELRSRLALANSSIEQLATRCVVGSTIGFLLPILAWVVVVAMGTAVPAIAPIGASLVLGIMGSLIPIAELNAASKRGRRHAMRVLCSFLDLVVLGLAGGMGIESALLTAAQLGENPVSRRLVAELSLCRDAGDPPWHALARLGETLGLDELGEVAATAGLAGMEGSKVRATLAARASSIRRHQLGDEEAEANALTERLFVPGAFLLVGFLLFIGYPAFSRIASGL